MMNFDSRLESLMSPMTEKPLGCLSRCVIGFFGSCFCLVYADKFVICVLMHMIVVCISD